MAGSANFETPKVPKKLSDYGKYFPYLLNEAKTDTTKLKEVLQIMVEACNEERPEDITMFLKKWKKQWNLFLAITVPKMLFMLSVGKYDIDSHLIIQALLSIFDNMEIERPLSNDILDASVLLAYSKIILEQLYPSLRDKVMKDLKFVEDLQRKFYCPNAQSILDSINVSEGNFRFLSVIPTKDDLAAETPDLKPSIINGDYENIEQYLDINFRLMREDLLYGLRKGIVEYRFKLEKKESLKNIDYVRVYKSVKFQNLPLYTQQGLLYKADIEVPQEVDWETTKRMKPGNLLCLSKDEFQTMTFVTIARRSPHTGVKKQCTIHIKVEAEKLINDKFEFNTNYVLLEPETFYEGYRHVLNTLKNLTNKNFPFSEHLIKPKSKRIEYPDRWLVEEPSVNYDKKELDPKQEEAVNLAMLSPVALIQGPPGTGKTYVGLKIVKQLQKNKGSSPILVVCYTNHALDQFLEGILSVTKRLIRVGSQSDSTKLKPHFLFNVLEYVKYYKQQQRLKSKTNKYCIKGECQNESEEKSDILISKDIAHDLMPSGFPDNIPGSLRNQLSDFCKEMNKLQLLLHNTLEDPYQHEEVLDEMLSRKFKSQLLGNEESGNASMSLVMCIKEWLHLDKMENVAKDLNFVTKVMGQDDQYNGLICKEQDCVNNEGKSNNPWFVRGTERYRLFSIWQTRLIKKCKERLNFAEKFYHILQDQIKHSDLGYKYQFLKCADVIGFTTTGAAKNRELIEKLKPQIVIVEEAAEIVEMHILTSLPSSIKKLILIGDHEQLKPNPSNIHLSRDYNLDVSLFERLCKNRLPHVKLQLQRRMSPCIARLLVPEIYKTLDNHCIVHMYKNIKGMKSNVFFINHAEPEADCVAEKTHVNFHEAKFMVGLCHYLTDHQKYGPHQITVLTMYMGQQKLLRRLMDCVGLPDIRVSTVDSFQGEENHIILISFVRSNESDVIGFLDSSNRVCVALSRAMGGLYCIGNFELYAKKNRLWLSLTEKLKERNEFGKELFLDDDVKVAEASDFRKLCGEPCSKNSENGNDFFTNLNTVDLLMIYERY